MKTIPPDNFAACTCDLCVQRPAPAVSHGWVPEQRQLAEAATTSRPPVPIRLVPRVPLAS